MKKAIIYCRVSTEEQASKGISIDAQERNCSKLAQEQGYQIVEVIKDEGQSGGTLKRPGMQRLLRITEESPPDALFTLHSDRLSRDVDDHRYLRKLFKTKNVKTVFAIGLNFDDSAMGQTMDTMTAAMNQMIRLIVSEKTKSALDEKAKEGWFPGIAPIGYINVDNPNFRNGELSKRIIIPDQERARFIKETFRLYATGNYNGYELNALMYKKGLRTRGGNQISRSKFYELLKNPIYIGELHWGNTHLKIAKHKPLIKQELFNQVQLVMDNHSNHACRRRKYQFLLSGFVYCAKCGKRMIGEWHVKKSGLKFGYYHCSSVYGCKLPDYAQLTDLEKQVENLFENLKFSDEFIEMIVSEAEKIMHRQKGSAKEQKTILNSRMAVLENKRDTIEDKLSLGVLGDEAFGRIEAKIKQEIDVVKDELSRIEIQKDVNIDEFRTVLKFIRDVYKTYIDGSPELKRGILSYFWKQILIENKKIVKAEASQLMQDLLTADALWLKTNKKSPTKTEDLILHLPARVRISTLMGAHRESNPDRRVHNPEL